MNKLTCKQQNILDYLKECIENNGYTPTIREIADYFNYKSTNAVNDHLQALIKKGYINKKSGAARTIMINAPEEEKKQKNSGVPIIGSVAAGTPISAVENLDGYLELSDIYDDSHFALRVKGDSMIDAGIWNGDYVIVKEQQYLSNGEIGVAIIAEEATVKRICIESDEIILYPENEQYSPLHIDITESDFRIAGKVVGLHRTL